MKLKADLHIHTLDDKEDNMVKHNVKEVIDEAQRKNFDVLSITNHNQVDFNAEISIYAENKGIVLLPGVELSVQNKHVLLINPENNLKISSISHLKDIKSDHTLVIAPHPFYPGFHSLSHELEKNIGFFDGIEFCHFYSWFFNFNKKAASLAYENNIPLIGNSDAHELWQIGTTYTLIDAKKDKKSIIRAVKEKKTELVTQPLSGKTILKSIIEIIYAKIKKFRNSSH
ncbi:MAG: PHP domain-containing protein [Thermodesulfobacteriota bacterium]|nr:PHP domain-containing protein [Thermodesulfobacteriota bacterium]